MFRIDSLMVNRKLVTSREKAKVLIQAGQVKVNNIIVLKPSCLVDENSEITILGEVLKYVGRGGLKLEKALNCFNINLENKICADIGASTGGFTDCMLINGAKKVYAVDVGHGQLAKKLREDNRVINLEGVNVRYLLPEHIPQKLDFISVDVSFISLTLILSVLEDFLSDNGLMVCLVKPQFEAGRNNISKNGILKSLSAHIEVIERIILYCSSINLYVKGLTFSPVKGGDGNIEYLLYLDKSEDNRFLCDIKDFVGKTFESLKNI